MASSYDEALLAEVVRAAQGVRLECVLIGNAAAALLGAPVTSVDLDFFIRDTPRNQAKLERLEHRDEFREHWNEHFGA